MSGNTTRRNFLITGVAVTGSIVRASTLQQQVADTAKPPATMPERVLGRTGVKVPIFGLGGAGQTPLSSEGKERDAVAIIRKALLLGIRYFDTAADYGPSEDYLGKVLPSYRSKIFLASKTDKRDRDGAWRELERSLKRLNTDHLDLWQLHHVSSREELNTIFSSSGAVKALEEAMQQKLVRFVGITGHHDPEVIAEGLRRYPFHTTLIPVNAADKHHPRPFLPVVLPIAQQKNVGVIAMKVPAYGRLFKPGGLSGMQQAMGYSLSQAGVHCCVIAAETIKQLEDNVNVAQAFQPLGDKELAAIEQRSAAVWKDGTFFRAWA
ncbi:aldo/keto reductase [Brasilonema octagenarum UFV-E1]|uniref:Aldo/keto reductase n=1 Tax=Brasilonema sennae CENA114 TaxID=415709 RepID=A0A856ME99_9CYAN|nr:aldo/keto reductase [Brasilonema sennae]QDL09038.1 aldo/keto reductase [Brasilonema sennae CENA114]QDL15395.1 aldo/keto reductase [Brasilonema octagenarum UFV-E1]